VTGCNPGRPALLLNYREVTDPIPQRRHLLFERLTECEILDLPAEQVEALVLMGQPIVFKAGSATVLGEFRREASRLVIELAQIDGGGEGVLVSLGALARRYVRLNGIDAVEWIVHAVNCAEPNLKLRRVLDRRGFIVRNIDGIGEAFYRLDGNVCATDSPAKPRAGWAESL
jgi:hypothetical protein